MKTLLLKGIWFATLPLMPLVFPQALYVKRTTLRLPEAQGPRTFSAPNKAKLSLLHVGESTVAGVGVDEIQQGFTHHLAQSLAQHKSISPEELAYHVLGENGIRLNALNDNIQSLPAGFDVAVVTMGVNDCSKFTSIKKWRADLHHCIKSLKQKTNGPIFFTQVPPMADFPALPFPIKNILGLRATLLDKELQSVCQLYEQVSHLNIDVPLEENMMARDGYHPSGKGYEAWAQLVAPSIIEKLNS